MIWFRLKGLISSDGLTAISQRAILVAASLSICGTLAVETPFLLHLAGTSEWQRVVVLALGFGVIIASGAVLFWRRDRLTGPRIAQPRSSIRNIFKRRLRSEPSPSSVARLEVTSWFL